MTLNLRYLEAFAAMAFLSSSALIDAMAQLGMDEETCRRRYGEPVMAEGSTNGVRTLVFITSNDSVEVSFYAGVVRRAAHRGVTGGDKDVERILADSADGTRWDRWKPRGRRHAESDVEKWIRSDGAAFAEMDGTVLTITAEGWSMLSTDEVASATGDLSSGSQNVGSVPASNAVVNVTVTDPLPPRANEVKTPPPRPRPPAQLPAKGDTRDDVLRLLNEPPGKLAMRGVEIMVYPWGRVWIRNGKVLVVE